MGNKLPLDSSPQVQALLELLAKSFSVATFGDDILE